MSLEIVVAKAVNLPNLEKFGKIDPYVSIEFQGVTKKTEHVESELNPTWNQTLTFDLKGQPVSEQDELKIFVKDYERIGPNRLVGMCSVFMRDVLRGSRDSSQPVVLDLTLTDANHRPLGGNVSISILYRAPPGTDPNSQATAGRVIGSDQTTADTGDEVDSGAAGQAGGGGGTSGVPGASGAVSSGARKPGNRSTIAVRSNRAPLSTKPQDFQLRVKVIEGRQLQGANISPICRVACKNVIKQTHVIKSTNSPFWDEIFFFNFANISPAELLDESLTFEVFNSRKLISDAIIGSFKCDIGVIYDEPRHALINKWLLLSSPVDLSEGVKGYLKICAALLGPGDDAPSFAAMKPTDEEDIESNLLRPAGVSLRPATFKLKVYCAEDLPRMDSDFMQGVKKVFGGEEIKQLVDPYFTFSFAGAKASTKIMYNNDHPEWNQELRLGLHFPSMCDKIKLQIKDWDRLADDDIISTGDLQLKRISHVAYDVKGDDGFLPTFGPCFVNFYGAPREYSDLPTEFDSLNEGKGVGVAYRGRVLLELETVLGEMPPTLVEELVNEDLLRVQKFQRRRKFKLHSAFLNASMISAIDAPVEFEVSIGNYGNKLDENLPPSVCSTQPTNAVFDGSFYYFLPWAEKKPCIAIDCHWEDILFRLEALNMLLSIAERLENNINTLYTTLKANMPIEDLAQFLISSIDQLIIDCKKPMPCCNPMTQQENELDKYLTNWREVELRGIVKQASALRESATDVKDAITELEHYLSVLQKLAIEPQNSIPDVVIWMITGEKRIAYYRCPSHLVLWSPVPEYRGKYCGKLETISLSYPGSKAERDGHWEIPALVRVRIWLGLEKQEQEWHRMMTEGDISVYAETYENQVSILGSWTNKGPTMSRPKFSDATGKIELNREDFQPPAGWKWDSEWYISPELSMLYDKDTGHKSYMEDVYENQSRLPGTNWAPASIPWTDVKGDTTTSKQECDLPPGWEWQDQWQVDLNRAVDEYGWEYTVEATLGGYGPVEKRYHMCRRRRWVRTRKLVAPSVKPQVPQEKKELKGDSEGWEYAPMFTMKYHAKERKVDIVRRRRWHRKMIAESMAVVDKSSSCYFKIPAKKDDAEPVTAAPRMFLTCHKPCQYQLRAYIYQARGLLAGDSSGLSDPFARIVFLNQSQATERLEKSLCPTWDQTLIFESVDIRGDPKSVAEKPPQVVIEIFDHDSFGSAEFLGRAFAVPMVKLDPSKALQPLLQWFEIKKGDEAAGEILAAFELFLIDPSKELPFVPPKRGQLYSVPTGIRPQLIRTAIEVLCWGVRSMARFQLLTVQSPSVELEVGGQLVHSRVIRNTQRNPNFDEPLLFFDIMLPKEELYTPPINIRVRDNRQFGRKPLVGVHSVKSMEQFRCRPLAAIDDEDPLLPALTSALSSAVDGILPTTSRDHVIDFPDDNSNIMKKSSTSVKSTGKPIKIPDEDIDWWSKYYASTGDLSKCQQYLELGYDKLEVFTTELERVGQHSGFTDFCNTFTLSRGKNIEDEESSIAGEFKGTFRIYPLPSDPSAELPPRILRNLPLSSPVDCIVRIYIVRAIDLQPADPNGLADPYVVVKIGKTKKESRDEYIPNTVNPVFGKMFEMQTSIPVNKDLRVRIVDFDLVSADDVIGETVIDLENRYLSKYRATVGLPLTYCTSGVNRWRDSKLPTELLQDFCGRYLKDGPVYRADDVVEIGNKVFRLADFEQRKPLHPHLGPAKERLALHVLNTLPASVHMPLVPEHIERRPLFNKLQPGIEQGQVEMWVDIFPLPLGPPGPPIDIKPRIARKYELRIVIWNTRDVILDETSITGEQMSDIYVKGWISGMDETQKTDVHYRSLDGEGNFNWRFVFPFDYIPAEQCIVVKKKQHFWNLDESERRLPPMFVVQIWDNDKFTPDDFLGTLELNLNSMPMSAKSAKSCSLDMLPTVVTKSSGGRPAHMVSLFEQKRIKGFWPCYTDVNGQRQLTGKVEMEMEIVSESEAKERPVGKSRDDPNQHPTLEPPKRPETSFLWFTSPFKTCKFIVWRHYKWYFIGALLLLLLIIFLILFIYAIPGTAAKKMFGVS